MNYIKFISKFLFLMFFIVIGCTDNDDNIGQNTPAQIRNFVWKGLNTYYLWKDDVPDLNDDRFKNQIELNSFLDGYSSPEILFQNLLFKPKSKFPDVNGVPTAIDRFSVIVNDYTFLENLLQGVSKSTGADFNLIKQPSPSNVVYGYITYIIPNSDAATKTIKRGDIFYAVNGISLTTENFRSLLGNETYTLNLANFDNGAITPNGNSISLTKTEITENPVFLNRIYEVGTKKVAYLVYNGFTSNFDIELNNAFGQIKVQGATDLVLDLRYNGGGSIQTAAYLASMITGQFTGQLFAKEKWNSDIQSFFENSRPESLLNLFVNNIIVKDAPAVPINSLNLAKVYILTTTATASASELVINSLKPYINVIQIGDITTGKTAGSITLYDSADFGKSGRSTAHKYAMQPLVLKLVNKVGFGEYEAGIKNSDYFVKENLGNLSELGNVNETYLSIALGAIQGTNRPKLKIQNINYESVSNSNDLIDFGNEMYLETPKDFNEALKFQK